MLRDFMNVAVNGMGEEIPKGSIDVDADFGPTKRPLSSLFPFPPFGPFALREQSPVEYAGHQFMNLYYYVRHADVLEAFAESSACCEAAPSLKNADALAQVEEEFLAFERIRAREEYLNSKKGEREVSQDNRKAELLSLQAEKEGLAHLDLVESMSALGALKGGGTTREPNYQKAEGRFLAGVCLPYPPPKIVETNRETLRLKCADREQVESSIARKIGCTDKLAKTLADEILLYDEIRRDGLSLQKFWLLVLVWVAKESAGRAFVDQGGRWVLDSSRPTNFFGAYCFDDSVKARGMLEILSRLYRRAPYSAEGENARVITSRTEAAIGEYSNWMRERALRCAVGESYLVECDSKRNWLKNEPVRALLDAFAADPSSVPEPVRLKASIVFSIYVLALGMAAELSQMEGDVATSAGFAELAARATSAELADPALAASATSAEKACAAPCADARRTRTIEVRLGLSDYTPDEACPSFSIKCVENRYPSYKKTFADVIIPKSFDCLEDDEALLLIIGREKHSVSEITGPLRKKFDSIPRAFSGGQEGAAICAQTHLRAARFRSSGFYFPQDEEKSRVWGEESYAQIYRKYVCFLEGCLGEAGPLPVVAAICEWANEACSFLLGDVAGKLLAPTLRDALVNRLVEWANAHANAQMSVSRARESLRAELDAGLQEFIDIVNARYFEIGPGYQNDDGGCLVSRNHLAIACKRGNASFPVHRLFCQDAHNGAIAIQDDESQGMFLMSLGKTRTEEEIAAKRVAIASKVKGINDALIKVDNNFACGRLSIDETHPASCNLAPLSAIAIGSESIVKLEVV